MEMAYSDEDVYSDNEEDMFNDERDDDMTETSTKSHHRYTILNTSDIQQRQQDDIARVSTFLSLSKAQATLLLVHYKWKSDMINEAWFADEEKVRKTVGLSEKDPPVQQVLCGICFEDYDFSVMFNANCDHLFCKSCYGVYVSTSIKDGPGCLTLRCPEPKCRSAVDQDMVERLVYDGTEKEKYFSYLVRSYVEANRIMKWCPAPGCDYAVEFTGDDDENHEAECKCTYSFCWNCVEDVHRPVDCDTVAKWILKNKSEAENVTWMIVNTKPCPKCKKPIEKNHGCMRMRCLPPCSYQFCWVCLGPYANYKHERACNKYETKEEKEKENAKAMLLRYAHYYERWAANNKSRVKALEDLRHTKDVHIDILRVNQAEIEIQLKFLVDAWEQIVECRRVLMWTYAYGYYLPEKEKAKKKLFEYLQGQAERQLERLHHIKMDLVEYLEADKPSKGFHEFRAKLIDLTNTSRVYFENLVRGLENGLMDVDEYQQKWYCEGCTFLNEVSATECEMCCNPAPFLC
ncbi:RBR-type E3 ubiquitin transferase [Ranunculus cassubicifolius]